MDTVSIVVCSHIDPVWLWDLSSGRRSWSNTITTALAMLRKNPDIIYTCSSAALYRWIEETNPAQFEEIRALEKAGRWEIAGGREVQSDTIVASVETLRRQGLSARAYFREKFGVNVRTIVAKGYDKEASCSQWYSPGGETKSYYDDNNMWTWNSQKRYDENAKR